VVVCCAVCGNAVADEGPLVPELPSASLSGFRFGANWSRISMFLGNTLYAVALIYYTYITFLGYNCTSSSPLNFGISVHGDSAAIPEQDAIIADSDPHYCGFIYHQSLWIPRI
jgi:UNC-50 family